MKSVIAYLLTLLTNLPVLAGPRVDIVIGEKAPALERLAANELANQLQRVYEADVKIGSTVPADSPHVIFVGSPDTNASMKPFAASWPSGDKKLTDQGHLLKSVRHRDRPALLIGGGSPVATYWAVAEFGHRLGIRSMLFGDLDPVAPPLFQLQGFELLIEPSPRHRDWHFDNWYFLDSGCWSTDEFRAHFRQLAKLRFNQVTITIRSEQPYVHFEYGGIQRSSSILLGNKPIVVSGDTAGRKVFGGAKLFEHPSFIGTQTYSERRVAAENHLRSVIAAAQEFGLRVHLHLFTALFPHEFVALWPEAKQNLPNSRDVFLPNLKDLGRDPQLSAFLRSYVRAVLETYPTVDGLEVVESLSDEPNGLRELFSQPGLLKRRDGREFPVTCLSVTDDLTTLIAPLVPANTSANPIMGLIIEPTPSSVLPSFRPQAWLRCWKMLRQRECDGFQVMQAGVGENDFPAYWLSRMSCGQAITPQQACRDLLVPVCGEEIDHRVWKAIELAESANKALAVRDADVGIPLLRLLTEKDEIPPQWNEARDGFLNAMNEMYRANTRAREGGRAFTLYLARRFEFAFEYLNCAEAARKAGAAERKKDTTTQIAELEKAIESLNNALDAMAAVARTNSDRGLIAVLNENGYRPLKKKLTEAEEAAK